MKSQCLRLLLVAAASIICVQGFVRVPLAVGATRDAHLSSCSMGSSNDTSVPKSRVFSNPNYVASPTPVVPLRVTGSRRTWNAKVLPENCQPWRTMARSLASAATQSDLTMTTRRLLQEAATSIHDMDMAWTWGDWEAVTYAAWDASQRVELVALSLQNHSSKDNSLQQAVAGMATELHEISSWRYRQGLAADQASQGNDHWARHFQKPNGSLDNKLLP
jgi:hypothetical protein